MTAPRRPPLPRDAVAITGTPGTGKSTLARRVAERRGLWTFDPGAEAVARGRLRGWDPLRRSHEPDLPRIRGDYRRWRKSHPGPGLLVGHWSPRMGARRAIVLRCDPHVLRKRLQARGYPQAKLIENLWAETLDALLIETTSLCPEVAEVDTTHLTPEEGARRVAHLLHGPIPPGRRPGSIQWDHRIPWLMALERRDPHGGRKRPRG